MIFLNKGILVSLSMLILVIGFSLGMVYCDIVVYGKRKERR
jgi:hypothetical protein